LVAVAAVAVIPVIGSAPAYAATKNTPKPPVCVIHSNPSQVESGNGPTQHSSIADIVQVECKPTYSEAWVTIDATQLNNACQGTLSWAFPPGTPGNEREAQFNVQLDNDGNAVGRTVVRAEHGSHQCLAERTAVHHGGDELHDPASREHEAGRDREPEVDR
jgi:hypothetical protein